MAIPVDAVAAYSKPPMCHSATLTQLADGRLFCAWYAGSYECAADTVLQWSCRGDTGKWSDARTIASFGGYGVGNPVVDCDPVTGDLSLYFVVLSGPWWSDSLLVAIKSFNDGQTWSAPVLISPERGLMCRTNIVHLQSGLLLLPIYREKQFSPLVLRSSDNGQTWEMVGDTTVSGRAIQPAIIELSSGRLAMYLRTTTGRIFVSYSFNNGASWTASQPTALPNPNSSVAVIRITDGRLVLAYNPSESTRDTLAFSLSADDGQTWSDPNVIASQRNAEYSYPTLYEDVQGSVHAVFTQNRSSIMHGVLLD